MQKKKDQKKIFILRKQTMTKGAARNLGETFKLQRKQLSVPQCEWVQLAQIYQG